MQTEGIGPHFVPSIGRRSDHRGRRLPSLDGLRGISILLVLFAHSRPRDLVALQYAQLGVSIFFVISGYIITRLLLEEHARTGDISLSKFYLRRTVRILPVLYMYLLVLALLKKHGFILLDRNGLFGSLTFLWSIWPGSDDPV